MELSFQFSYFLLQKVIYFFSNTSSCQGNSNHCSSFSSGDLYRLYVNASADSILIIEKLLPRAKYNMSLSHLSLPDVR